MGRKADAGRYNDDSKKLFHDDTPSLGSMTTAVTI
jgi:hypothetical protein